MAKKMKALLFPAVDEYQYIETDIPEMADDQVLLQVKETGVCHGDILAFTGKHPYRIPPLVSGHEMGGIVVSVGKDVTDFKVGDRVAVEPQIGCGVCEFCRKGDYNVCADKRMIGVDGWSGTYGEYVVAYPSMCMKIPNSMSYEESALIEPFCVGVHAVSLADLHIGDTAAVLGGGTIGNMVLTALTQKELSEVFCSDLSEKKNENSLKRGATVALNPKHGNIVDEVLRQTSGSGVDAVFVTSSYPGVMDDALRICKKKGVVVLIAFLDSTIKLNTVGLIQQGERRIVGSNSYTMKDYRWVLEQYGKGTLDLKSLITKKVPFSEGGAVIKEMAHGLLPDEIKVMISME